MGLPQFKSCCCGCSLRTGTQIIGWLALIGGLIMTIVYVYMSDVEALSSVNVGRALLSLIYFLISVLLLVGVEKDNARLVITWVIGFVVLTFLSSLLRIPDIFAEVALFGSSVLIMEVVLFVISLLIESYIILVVHSFYKEMLNCPSYTSGGQTV